MRGTHNLFGKWLGGSLQCRSTIKAATRLISTEIPGNLRILSSNRKLLHCSGWQQQDLRRFLEEIGTDPREARYWLRQFQNHESSPEQPFAVVQVDSEIMEDEVMLDKLASCLAFLHRNGMPVIIVHGLDIPVDNNINIRQWRAKVIEDNIELVDLLEKHGSRARPFMNSGHVLSVLENPSSAFHGRIDKVDVKPLQHCLRSGHIPVLTAVGESPTGQVLCVDSNDAAIRIAQVLKPMKVMFLNSTGGLVDRQGNILGNVSVSDDLEFLLKQPWHSETTLQQVILIAKLLHTLPESSSAVITSADSIIQELFTHKDNRKGRPCRKFSSNQELDPNLGNIDTGSGTMFLRPEKIQKHHTLATVDTDKLKQLLIKSFNKPLNADYFFLLEHRLHTLYVTESYSAAAVITNEEEVDGVKYLDKFTVGRQSQGLGTSDTLWRKIKQDFSCLFWRSRGTNRINPWYGISDYTLTQKLVEHAKTFPPSFDPLAPHDEEKSQQVLSSNGYHKFL
ncbi:N-acetylglutamate synthase [Acropora cervicornis]|uniref:N-acetylglutamate synthase n=1 Tax=Acropora cervicornis TaxID=6130 RepID=A0AAD9QI62_ACRCE|nr:N-acetylglutamate synthase [Acropora cervicornis]